MSADVRASGWSERFRLGVNYWPARTAMGWWTDFDVAEVGVDFERIGGARFDSVRLFLTWEDFQPAPNIVDTGMLDRLVAVADLAEREGLAIMPTLFTGHMSGVNWIPEWALGGTDGDDRFRVVSGGRPVESGLRNWYTDPEVGAAQVLQAGAAAGALAGHGAVWAWDLGNENSNCVQPPSRTEARDWLQRTTAAIRTADSEVLITTGLHMEDLEEDRMLGPAEAAGVCDFLTMHGYPIYAGWAAGPTDEHLVAFLAHVTRWLGGGTGVLFSEFGLPTYRRADPGAEQAQAESSSMLVEEQTAAAYTKRALGALRGAGCTGAMLWCHTDYAPAIWARPPLDLATHERSFGLWRADGSPKPSVEVVGECSGLNRVESSDSIDWIDIEADEYWSNPATHLARLYGRYRESGGITSR